MSRGPATVRYETNRSLVFRVFTQTRILEGNEYELEKKLNNIEINTTTIIEMR